jgi:hypothetical protein
VPGFVLVLGADGNECAAVEHTYAGQSGARALPSGWMIPSQRSARLSPPAWAAAPTSESPTGKRNQRESANGTVISFS